MSDFPRLREAVNVPEALDRDALVRRLAKMRADAVLDKNTIEHWNRLHPEEPPFSTAFEVAFIAWCDGEGPMPTLPAGATNAE